MNTSAQFIESVERYPRLTKTEVEAVMIAMDKKPGLVLFRSDPLDANVYKLYSHRHKCLGQGTVPALPGTSISLMEWERFGWSIVEAVGTNSFQMLVRLEQIARKS